MFLCSKLHTPARCLWRSSLLQNLGLYGRPLRFKYQQAEMMVVRSNSLDDKACLAMLAHISLISAASSLSLYSINSLSPSKWHQTPDSTETS